MTTPPPPDYVRRTQQAWARTGLSVVGVSAVVARLALLDGSWPTLAVAALALVAGAIAVLAHSAVVTTGAVAITGVATLALILS